MQPKAPIRNLLKYIYFLLAITSSLLIVVSAFLIQQNTKTSQQEKGLSQHLLPIIFDLQRLDQEIIEFQNMHTAALHDEDSFDQQIKHEQHKEHITLIHAQPIQRFIKDINDISKQTTSKTLQSAQKRLNNHYLHFNAALKKFMDAAATDQDTQDIAQSIQSLRISIHQVTRLYQREAGKVSRTLNDTYSTGVWKIIGIIIFAVILGAVVAIRILSLTRSAIARQQQADTELHQHREQLEKLVVARTADLELTNKELRSYSYSIAHDLRAPLRAITSFSQILLADSQQKLNDEENDCLQRISTAGTRMAELIDDILKLSTVSRTELSLKKTNLSRIANELCKQLCATNPEQKIDLRIQESLTAYVDPKLTRLAIEHLFSNAVKYSSHQHTSIIELGSEQIDGETVYFVRDNGIGFDMQFTEKLFQAFERVQERSPLDGSGIGLAMVHRIITKHRGRIWAKATVNQGATFYFTLPSKPHLGNAAAPLSPQ